MSAGFRSPLRRVAAAIGIAALLTTAGCAGSTVAGAAGPVDPAGATPPTLKRLPAEDGAEDGAEHAGFDECGLVEPDEVAEAIGADAMYVTSRSTMELTDGSMRVSCSYFPEDVPGMMGMELSTVLGTDQERFFAGFDKFTKKETIAGIGDHAEGVAYSPQGSSTHFIEIRAISGDQGLHLFYSYNDEGGVMPSLKNAEVGQLLTLALERIPAEVTVGAGAPEGGCADLDLESAEQTVGAEFERVRSVLSDDGGLSCHFSGDSATVEVAVLVDPTWVDQQSVPADKISHPDLGEGGRVLLTEVGTLDARINLGDRLVSVLVNYDESVTVTEPREDDVDLVRSIVDSLS